MEHLIEIVSYKNGTQYYRTDEVDDENLGVSILMLLDEGCDTFKVKVL